MCCANRNGLIGALLAISLLAACSGGEQKVPVPGREGRLKTSADLRADRRAYDGAPPVIPHENFGMECTSCHDLAGLEVPSCG